MSKIFDRYAEEYDGWFDKNKEVFRSELEAVKRFMPEGDIHHLRCLRNFIDQR